MYCKDCAHWKDNYVAEDGSKYCDYSAPWTAPCDHDWEISWTAADDHGLMMALSTKPMFGCVNFKQRAKMGAA